MVDGNMADHERSAPGSLQAMAAYQSMAKERIAALEKQYCFAVDWFPESLPLENRFGSSMQDKIRQLTDTGAAVFGLPLPDEEPPAPPPAVDVLVFSDNYGYCKGILDKAPKGRVGKKNIVTKAPGSLTQKDVSQLLSSGWDLVIFGSGIDTPASNSVDDVLKQQNAVTKLFFFICQEIMKNKDSCKQGLVCLTVDTFADEPEIHEECGVGITSSGTLFGMSNTARTELELPVQYIETEWSLPEECMPALSSEVFRRESLGRNTVRILKGGRYVLRQVTTKQYADVNQRELPLPEKGGIIAISGGNGALALVLGDWLLNKAKQAGKSGFDIKFLSRSMKIGDDNKETWERIEKKAASLGITVEQAKCDVSKQSAVDEFIAKCSPNLAGFIHSAGVLRDAMLLNQTWDKFEDVFDGKSRAALYLHDALARFSNPNLKFFWMFSSTSVYGNMGQINYSGSNSYLDALARHRRAMNLPGMVVQWGAWGEVGMAANLDQASKARFAQSPMPPFANSEGLAGLEVGIRSNIPYFSVFKYNPEMMFQIVSANTGVTHAYGRNFTSNVYPLPIAQSLDDPYDFVRSTCGGTVKEPQNSALVYRQFCGDSDDES